MTNYENKSGSPTGGTERKNGKFGNRGHVTVSQPRKPSERPAPKPPSSEKK